MITRRTFILGSGAVALTKLAPFFSTSEYLNGSHFMSSDPLDKIHQKYPFASTAILRLACWDDFLDTEDSVPNACQYVQLSTNWKTV